MISRAFSSNHLNRTMPTIRLVIRYQEFRVSLIEPEADVQRRQAALFVLGKAFNRSPWTVGRSTLVVGELSVLQQVIPAHITASDLAVEVVALVHKPMLSRDGEGKVGLVALVFPDHSMSNLPQLTLFPRWSRPIWITAWEQRKLGNCGTTYGGLTGKTKEDFGHGNARFIPYTNVFDNPLTDTKRLEAVEIDSSQNQVVYGDVFFTVSSETPDEVGMSSVWLSDQEDVYLNSFCFGYRQDSTFDPHYLAYMLRSSLVRSNLTLLAQGISRFNISKNKVMELSVPVPSVVEQKQLGQYFTKLDSLITLHQ